MIKYVRDDERRCARVTIAGSVTVTELIAIVDRQASEGTWKYGLLYDIRALDDPPSLGDLDAVLAHVRQLALEHGRRGPVAFVSHSAVVVGTALMYSHLAGDDLAMEVFWDTEGAERWLDQQTRP